MSPFGAIPSLFVAPTHGFVRHDSGRCYQIRPILERHRFDEMRCNERLNIIFQCSLVILSLDLRSIGIETKLLRFTLLADKRAMLEAVS